MPSTSLLIEKGEGVAMVTLNRPDKLNAINEDMKLAFLELVDSIRSDNEIKAIILTGAGRGFCSGADLVSQTVGIPNEDRELSRQEISEPEGIFIFRLAMLDKPVIAAINGVAAAAGLSLALVCDIRIASVDAKFTPMWVKRGMIADAGATYLLPKLLGTSKALELMYTGDTIDAVTAEKLGLVNKVVAKDQLIPQAREIALRWARGPSIAIELMKRAVYNRLRNELESQIYFETTAQNICVTTDDCQEAVKAFLEKREPVFKGK